MSLHLESCVVHCMMAVSLSVALSCVCSQSARKPNIDIKVAHVTCNSWDSRSLAVVVVLLLKLKEHIMLDKKLL